MSEPDAHGWRPIATAPAEGRILGWCVFPAGAETRTVTRHNGQWWEYGIPQYVTHWQPLPAPPEENTALTRG